MNILYINHYAGSISMGMEFRPYYFAREWQKMGHKVRIIGASYSHLRKENPKVEKDFEIQMIDGVEYQWIKTGTYNGNGVARAMTMFEFCSKLWLNAKRIVKEFQPDVVIASSTYPLDTYPIRRISKRAKAKYIHEVHDMWPATLYEVGGLSKYSPFVVLMQMAENYAYRNCNELVALMPYSKEYMVEHGLQAEKFHNIQNGIQEEEWDSNVIIPKEHQAFFDEHDNQFIVGYFGGHALSNALDNLLDAAKANTDKDVIFVLVGSGVEKQRLMKRQKTESINNVYFLDAVEKKAVPDLLKNYDCSIMTGIPSPLYRFGLCLNKMYDSMMAGKPIICAITAPKTMVEEYKCGIQVNDVDTEHINKAISDMKSLSNKEREEMGGNGKRAVLEKFTYSVLARMFERLMH